MTITILLEGEHKMSNFPLDIEKTNMESIGNKVCQAWPALVSFESDSVPTLIETKLLSCAEVIVNEITQ